MTTINETCQIVNMAGYENLESLVNDSDTSNLVSKPSRFEIKPYVGDDGDEHDGSDDSMLNLSGRFCYEDQIILREASSSVRGKPVDNNDSRSNYGDNKDNSRQQRPSHEPTLSEVQNRLALLADGANDNQGYANPDLFSVPSNYNNTAIPTITTTSNSNSNSVQTPTQQLFQQQQKQYQQLPQSQQLHQFDQLNFADPTFINTFSPPFTPSPRRTPTLPLAGQPINTPNLFSPEEPRDVYSAFEGETNHNDKNWGNGFTRPDVVPPLTRKNNIHCENNPPRSGSSSPSSLLGKTRDVISREVMEGEGLMLMSPSGNSNTPTVLPGMRNNTTNKAHGGEMDAFQNHLATAEPSDYFKGMHAFRPTAASPTACHAADVNASSYNFSTASNSHEFTSNNNNNNTVSSDVLSVGRNSQITRPQSEPSRFIRRTPAAPGSGGGGGSGNRNSSSNGGPNPPGGMRAMVSPLVFGLRGDDSAHQPGASLFPPDEDDGEGEIAGDDRRMGSGNDNTLDGDGCLSVASYRGHCHNQRMANTVDKVARRQLLAVVVLCLLFMIGEAVGGALSNSLALFTDVLHLGSDLISFLISLLALYLSTKPASKTMSYGYHRAEVLGALFSVFLIWLVSGVLCYIAVERIMHEHYKDVKPDEMLITASLGVVFNIIMGIVLHSEVCCKGAHSHSSFGHNHSHGGGHSHSHGNSCKDTSSVEYQQLEDSRLQSSRRRRQTNEDLENSYQTEETRQILDTCGDGGRNGVGDFVTDIDEEDEKIHSRQKNLNVRAAFIHVVGDIIQSLGVLIAALIIKFKDDDRYRLADPICTFIFSIIVLITTISVLRDTIRVIMEGVPRDMSFDNLKRELLGIDGVVAAHSLHIWALTLDRNALSVHLAIEDPNCHDKVLKTATHLVQNRHHIYSSTIQVEMYNREVMNSCIQCLEPK